MTSGQKIFVGLSGGVDSSVAALLLREAGHDVYGVFIKVWSPGFLDCNWEQERLDAMRVAATLDIPFLTCDAERAYKERVAEYFIDSYAEGGTPNPDVMCNKHIKFGEFYNFAREYGADRIATGHYARLTHKEDSIELHRGIDDDKDQSYFLWSVSDETLRLTDFPIGDMKKSEVRIIAERNRLLTAKKKDSQGICFLGHVDIKDFLSHYIELKKGAVLDTDGKKIGEHDGSEIYTIGQRHGFQIRNMSSHDTSHFVIGKDVKQNTITVSESRPELKDKTLSLSSTNWIGEPPGDNDILTVQNRYRQTPVGAKLLSQRERSAELSILDETEYPAVGQSCVLYKGERCLGGGIIDAIT